MPEKYLQQTMPMCCAFFLRMSEDKSKRDCNRDYFQCNRNRLHCDFDYS